MDSSKLVDLYRDGHMVIPIYFLKNYKKWDLDMEHFVFLMYLYHFGDKSLFDPNQYMKDFNVDLMTVMQRIDSLTRKGFIHVNVIKNEKGLREERVELDGFYQKIMMITLDEVNHTPEDPSIYETFEKEFGRTLSPMEYEIIKSWFERNIKEDIIKEALREATFNGVSNLRYIDKILYEWNKQGVKSIEDVEKLRNKRNKKEDKDFGKDIDMNIVEWNWFDEDE